MAKNILITGATGKQGGAVIKSLLNSPGFKLYGLTRNTTSARAQALSKQISLVSGDTTQPSAIFSQLPPIWGVFSVTIPGKNEESQAIPLIDESVKRGVKHFVFTSADRGNEKSDSDPTPVPHFITKFNIEKHLKESSGDMHWTILRPVAFYDNLTPDFMGRAFSRMVQQIGDHKLALVASADVGRVAAGVFEKSEMYRGEAFPVVGDSLTFGEMQNVFKGAVGQEMELAPGFLATFFKWAVHDLGVMFNWFGEGGYSWDVKKAKESLPAMMDFGTWLRTESKFVTKK